MEQVWVKEGICDKRRLGDEGGQIGKGDKGKRGWGSATCFQLVGVGW